MKLRDIFKLSVTPGEKRLFIGIGILWMLLYGYPLWQNRDITWRWEEEVQLMDGTRIIVEREHETEVMGGGEPFKDSRGIKMRHISFTDGNVEVSWQSPLAPMILARGLAPGQWIVIASPIFCKDHYKYGSPKPPYVQFEYANGHWTHRPVDPVWYGKPSNLLMAYDKFKEYDGGFVKAEMTQKFNDPVNMIGKDYLSVDKNYISNCYR